MRQNAVLCGNGLKHGICCEDNNLLFYDSSMCESVAEKLILKVGQNLPGMITLCLHLSDLEFHISASNLKSPHSKKLTTPPFNWCDLN